jgi:predicted nucleotidyltransferase
VLADERPVRFAVLFGSQASGRVTPMSDVDVAVMYQQVPDLLEMGAIVSRLEQVTKEQIDLVTLNGLAASDPVLAYRIVTEGVPILVSDEGGLLEFRTRACLLYFDTAPLRHQVEEALARRVAAGKTGMRNYE